MNQLTGKRYDVLIKDVHSTLITVWTDNCLEDVIKKVEGIIRVSVDSSIPTKYLVSIDARYDEAIVQQNIIKVCQKAIDSREPEDDFGKG